MASGVKKKASQDTAANQPQKDVLLVPGMDEDSKERFMVELGLSPVSSNANTARSYAKGAFGELDINESCKVMREKIDKVKNGDLSGIEASLTAQAVTLEAIFNELARRASLNMGQYINAMETYLRLALKAQGQCRATLETLAEIKNPCPVAFVKQANIAHGMQQVNNGNDNFRSNTRTHARAENYQNEQNKLLEDEGYECPQMDNRATPTPSRSDSTMEALERVNRT